MSNFITILLSILTLLFITFNWVGLPALNSQTVKIENVDFIDLDTLVPPSNILPPPPPPPPPPIENNDSFVCSIREQLPFLLSCQEEQDTRKCSGEFLVNFIKTQLEYPPLAKKANIEGVAVITFMIEKDGTMTNLKIVRDKEKVGFGEEGLRILTLLAEQGAIWVPAKQRGRPIRITYNMPVKFKLDE